LLLCLLSLLLCLHGLLLCLLSQLEWLQLRTAHKSATFWQFMKRACIDTSGLFFDGHILCLSAGTCVSVMHICRQVQKV